eukprot:1934460-Pyramimonas_sp.AAC.1
MRRSRGMSCTRSLVAAFTNAVKGGRSCAQTSQELKQTPDMLVERTHAPASRLWLEWQQDAAAQPLKVVQSGTSHAQSLRSRL